MTRRIDDSHAPFKRTNKIGPGPKKRPSISQDKNWECQKGKNTAKHYVQVCTYVGSSKKRRGKTLTVKTLKSVKKAYNKVYREWAAKNARIKALTKRGPKKGYRCRQTKIAKCGG